jgi:hypothetical protein
MTPLPLSALFAAADVKHRLASRLLDGFDDWWQMPAVVLVAVAVAAYVVWMVRRDAVDLSRPLAALLAVLRLAALAAVAAAILDVERIAEHEIALPSRVAVLVDSSASMSLADGEDPAGTRAAQAADLLESDLLAAVLPRHEVSVWRFDADAAPVLRLPSTAAGSGRAAAVEGDWRSQLAPGGAETRLGEAVSEVVAGGAAGTLAGVIVLSDGGQNAGLDPRSAASAAARAGVAVHAIGVGSDVLPANVRVADLVAPARVFPGDRFAVSAFLQPQGFAGERVRVELVERPATDTGGDESTVRVIDDVEAVLGGDGDLVPVRFDVAGLPTPGRRLLAVRVVPPAADRSPADDTQGVDVEVVDRVTQVLLMAGGPGREYQFMRNVLERDKSFAVDVLLGTAAAGISQDARRILDAFPAADESLGGYDAVVAIDYDWRLLEPAAQARLERWVAGESGGLVLVAGGVFMDAWLGDPRTAAIRGLYPLELRRRGEAAGAGGGNEPRRLALTRDGSEAEFLRLAGTAAASVAVWEEFPGVYSCYPAVGVKPGATVYARLAPRPGEEGPAYLAGQFYGSGSVIAVGSGEFWRLRSLGDEAYERLVAQLVRHVAQGRLMRGSRRGRLIVEQDRVAVGGTVRIRVVTPGPGQRPECRAVAPDGSHVVVPLVDEPARPGTLAGGFVATREGGWLVEVEPVAAGEERLSRRIQVQLPDRELAHPRLDRGVLSQLATATGGSVRCLADGGFTRASAEAIAAALPDRSRREYESGAADVAFKRRLNAVLLAIGTGCLCLEWIVRRLARLA